MTQSADRESSAAAGPGLSARVVGAAGRIVLERPAQHNAITNAMRATLASAYPRFARDPQVYAVLITAAEGSRAFSAGGDIRELVQLGRHDPIEARRGMAAEYELNWLHECFSKPTVSLIDGLVVGSGVGITLYGTHRVAGERYAFAMPETAIGLFPDVGVAHAFARMPHAIGVYLALTGRRIGRADALWLGLVTHCVPAARFPEIEALIGDADPVDPVLDTRHEDPGRGELEALTEPIADAFGRDDVTAIRDRLTMLQAKGGAGGRFAEETLAVLARQSPTSLKVTLRHVREAARKDLRETLVADYRIACRMLAGHDFHEGVRAAVIDKDRTPAWRPAGLAEVTASEVDSHFAEPEGGDLVLPTRSEMQARRV